MFCLRRRVVGERLTAYEGNVEAKAVPSIQRTVRLTSPNLTVRRWRRRLLKAGRRLSHNGVSDVLLSACCGNK